MSNVEAVQTLVNLGLTVLQAKTYLALAKLDTSTGRTTAKAANISPSDIYRILTELKEKGLVEKVISKPNKYRAVSLEDGSSMLYQFREKQTTELKKAIDHLCLSYEGKQIKKNREGNNEFVLIPNGKMGSSKAQKMSATAQTSLDLMIDYDEAMNISEEIIHRAVKCLDNGVKIRQILGNTARSNKTAKWIITLQKRSPEYQVRYNDFPNPATLIIKDNEVFFGVNTNSKREQPHLWSNNPVLVQVIKEWYNSLWENIGKESEPIK